MAGSKNAKNRKLSDLLTLCVSSITIQTLLKRNNMFDIQGTVLEKAEIQNLLNILQETKIGAMLIKHLKDLLNGRSSIVLKFDRALSVKGLCEFKQVTLNPRLLTTQNECVSTLGHELAHAVMWDIQKLALNNSSSLNEYALVKLLSETHGHNRFQ